MAKTAIVGINWGDEGKGRMVDLIAGDFDYVIRYQGGNNAGHTVKNELGRFILNLLPSGIFHKNTMNVLGNGMVINLEHLVGELKSLKEQGIDLGPDRLMISDRAMITFPYHVQEDCMQEQALGDHKFGSTKRGIGPCYGDKVMKFGIQVGEILLGEEHLLQRLRTVLEHKNAIYTKAYGAPAVKAEDMLEWLKTFGTPLIPYIRDCGAELHRAIAAGKELLFEAQLGALRDIEFGIYPFTTSSSPLAAYAPIGAGVPGESMDRVIGVVKAYSSCVGEGPFTAELFGQEAHELREAGAEYGAATGRPRRVGGFDVPATRFGLRMQGASEIALTKLDVLGYGKPIPYCTEYTLDGKTVEDFPFPALLAKCEPVYEYLPGWTEDITDIRRFEDLPETCRNYVLRIEKDCGCPIRMISVGPGRDQLIYR